MPEFWLDANCLITPHRNAYRFSYGSPFWDFMETKAHEGVIGSPQIVFDQELASTEKIADKDMLELWARELKGVLFLPPDDSVQIEYGKVLPTYKTVGDLNNIILRISYLELTPG